MEDLIRRSDAIKAVLGITMYENRVPIDTVIYNIKSLPSADRPSTVDLSSVYSTAYKSGYEKGKADRPQGEWIVSCKDSICPICGKDEAEFICGTEDWYGYGLSNYCPNCGARMKGADDE